MTATSQSDSPTKRPLLRPVFWWLMVVPVVVGALSAIFRDKMATDVFLRFAGGFFGVLVWTFVALGVSGLAYRALASPRRRSLALVLALPIAMAVPTGLALLFAYVVRGEFARTTVWEVVWIAAGAAGGLVAATRIVLRRRSRPAVEFCTARGSHLALGCGVSLYFLVWLAVHVFVGGADFLEHGVVVASAYAGAQAYAVFAKRRAFAAADGIAVPAALAAMVGSVFVHDLAGLWWYWPLSHALLICVVGFVLALPAGHLAVYLLLGPARLLRGLAWPLTRRLPHGLRRRRTIAWSLARRPGGGRAPDGAGDGNPPQPRPRRLQFGLRALLAATLGLGVLSGWIGIHLERGRVRQRAIEAIVQNGGYVSFDYGGATYRGIPVSQEEAPPGPAWIQGPLGRHFFARVHRVELAPEFDDTDLDLLKHLRGLRALEAGATEITDTGMAQVGGLRGLERLSLRGTAISDEGLEHLRHLDHLWYLDLDFTAVSDDSVPQLAAMARLARISLWDTRISEGGAERLRQSRRWGHFDHATAPSEQHRQAAIELMRLGAFLYPDPNPRDDSQQRLVLELDPRSWKAGGEALRHLVHLRGPTELRVVGVYLGDEGVDCVRQMQDLEGFTCLQGTLTDGQLVKLASLSGLTDLRLECPAVTDAGLECLDGMKDLRSLTLSGMAITGSGLAHLRAAKNLETLQLDATALTDAGLAHVAGARNLTTLVISRTAITDAGLVHLRGLKKLSTLDLSGTAISGSGLAHLEGLTQLEELWLYGTQATLSDVKKLQAALPHTDIFTDVGPPPPLPPPPASAPEKDSEPATEKDP